MLSLMQLSQSADRMVLAYPLWTGMAFFAVAAALAAVAVLARRRLWRRWPVSAAIVVAAWAGVYFTTFNATLTADSGRVYGFMRYDHALDWKDAIDVYLERSTGAGEWRIVVLDRNRREVEFSVADLAVEERDRVMAWIVDRMPESAFRRAPALLKREGGDARRVSLFPDQQI
jgi:hypothetical protein